MESPALPDWLASPGGNVSNAVVLLDPDGRVLSLNPEAESLAGRSSEEAVGLPVTEVLPIRDEVTGREPTGASPRVALASGTGELLTFDLTVVPLGAAEGWAVVLERTHSPLATEAQAWAALTRTSSQGLAISAPESETLGIVSEAFAAMHGYSAREMLGMPVAAIAADPAAVTAEDGCVRALWTASDEDGGGVCETEHRRKDGSVFPVRITGLVVRDPIGEPRFRVVRVEDITERRAAQKGEEEAWRLTERVLQVVPSILYIHDVRERSVLFLSKSSPFVQSLAPTGELTLDAIAEAVHPHDRERAEAHFARAASLASGEAESVELRLRDPLWGWRWFLAREVPFEVGPGGRTERTLGAATDITELKESEESLRNSEGLRDVAASAARMAMWWWDVRHGEARLWNDYGQIYGFGGRDVRVGLPALFARIDARDRGRIEAAMRRTMATGVAYEEECRSNPTSGEVRWLVLKGERVLDETGRPIALAGVSLDITSRKEAEEALRASEERARRLIESATDYAIFTMDLERRVTSWNSGAEAIFGYSEAEMLGQSGDILFTPEDQRSGEAVREAETALAQGRAEDERWHVRKDGSRFYASGVATPLSSTGSSGPQGFVKIARDLTERKQHEETVEAATERLRIAMEAAEMGMWEWDMVEDRVLWNRRQFELLGVPPSDEPVNSQVFLARVHPEDRPDVEARLARSAAEGAEFEAEFRAVAGDGHVRWLHGYGRATDDAAGGPPTRLSGVTFDITARKEDCR